MPIIEYSPFRGVETTQVSWFRRLFPFAFVAGLLLVAVLPADAEKVATLPAPTGYVNDFARVLTPETKQSLEDLCTQVDKQAHAQIAVVTVKTIDDDQPIEDFAVALEEKWKVGHKGTDRGLLMLFVMTPRKGRIEVGYGLEGILNDAKVGDIGRTMSPYSRQNDYNQAISLGVQQIAQVIVTDAGATLTGVQPIQRNHGEAAKQSLSRDAFELVIPVVISTVVIGVILLVFLVLCLRLILFLVGRILGEGVRLRFDKFLLFLFGLGGMAGLVRMAVGGGAGRNRHNSKGNDGGGVSFAGFDGDSSGSGGSDFGSSDDDSSGGGGGSDGDSSDGGGSDFGGFDGGSSGGGGASGDW